MDVAIILANFPIAFLMTAIAIWLMSRVTIMIHNQGNTSIDSLILTTRDSRYVFANIKPGASATQATMTGDLRAVSCDVTRNKQKKTYSPRRALCRRYFRQYVRPLHPQRYRRGRILE